MATWVTHLMIADRVLEKEPRLDRRGFCVGSIAPDCNIENADWSSFTPPREVTHFMSGSRKTLFDAERFYEKYILIRKNEIRRGEQYSFLLGYWGHLAADALFYEMIRDEERINAVWRRIKADSVLSAKSCGLAQDWDTAKTLMTKGELNREMHTLEAQYLAEHPESGYLTEIKTLKEFPDHIDLLPHGCIVRKIGIMGYVPYAAKSVSSLILISKAEHSAFVDKAVDHIADKLRKTEFYI